MWRHSPKQICIIEATFASAASKMWRHSPQQLFLLVATLASATMQIVVKFSSATLYISEDIRLSDYATCGEAAFASTAMQMWRRPPQQLCM